MRRHLRIKLPGSSMRRQGTYVFFSWSSNGTHIAPFEKIMTCISSYTHLITPATKYIMFSGIPFGENSFYRAPGEKWAQETCTHIAPFEKIMTCLSSYTHLITPATKYIMFSGIPFGENSFYRAPGEKWAQETCAGYPQQRYISGEPGNVQGRDRVGIVEGSCGYRACGVSIRGKFVLSRNPGYKTRGVAMWLNVVLTPG